MIEARVQNLVLKISVQNF